MGYHAGDVYKAIGRPDILFKLNIMSAAILVPALVIGSQFGLIGFAWGYLIAIVFDQAITLYVAGRFIRVSFWDILSEMKPAAAGILLMPSAAWGVLAATQLSAPFAQLPLVVLTGAAAYLLVVWRLEGSASPPHGAVDSGVQTSERKRVNMNPPVPPSPTSANAPDRARSVTEIYTRSIPWSLFAAAALLAAVVGGLGIAYGDLELKVLAFAGIIGFVVVMAIYQKPELGAYLLTIMVFTNTSDLLTNQGFPSVNKPLVAVIGVSILANAFLQTGKFKLPVMGRAEWASCSSTASSSHPAWSLRVWVMRWMDCGRDQRHSSA